MPVPAPSSAPMLVYTDGSMKPSSGTVGLAAYAVVVLPHGDDHTIASWMEAYHQTSQMPPFEIFAVGKVPCDQTNNRAELTAIIVGLQSSCQVCIVSDSTYALCVLAAVVGCLHVTHFVGWDNFDLICELVQVVSTFGHTRIEWQKIRSHQVFPNAGNSRDQLDYLGNQLADEVANQARLEDTVGFLDLHRSIEQHDDYWTSVLRDYYTYVIDMARLFQQAWKQHKPAPVVDETTARVQQLLAVVKEPVQTCGQIAVDPRWLDVTYFGQQFTEALLQWAQMLEWPVDFQGTATGVSFLELYMSFQAVTGLEAPLNVAKPHQHFPTYVMKNPRNLASFKARAPHQELRVFEFALTYLVKLTGISIFPLDTAGLTTSLSYLGERKPRTGFKVRCRFPYQEQICSHLLESISRASGHWGFDSVGSLRLPQLVHIPVHEVDSRRNSATMYEKFRKFLRGR
eukprot:Skav217883  [mRNA]  locus=scaffold67:89190:90557:+ [translate_table: standard]